MEQYNHLTETIIGCGIKVHKALGPGMLESAYRQCLSYELHKNGLTVEEEKPMPVIYDEIRLNQGYRLDLLVENTVVVELKTVEAFTERSTSGANPDIHATGRVSPGIIDEL